MSLNSDQVEVVAVELKKLSADLKLSESQKQRLHNFLSDAAQRIEEYKQQNPNASVIDLVKKVTDNRTRIRQGMAFFLSPDQLAKWDGEAPQVKEFLGLKTAA
jgi:hypothetical protein